MFTLQATTCGEYRVYNSTRYRWPICCKYCIYTITACYILPSFVKYCTTFYTLPTCVKYSVCAVTYYTLTTYVTYYTLTITYYTLTTCVAYSIYNVNGTHSMCVQLKKNGIYTTTYDTLPTCVKHIYISPMC